MLAKEETIVLYDTPNGYDFAEIKKLVVLLSELSKKPSYFGYYDCCR